MSRHETHSGGIGFMGLLTIVFITLKLIGTISWSWWWVLSPLWLPFTIFVGVMVLVGCGVFLIELIKFIKKYTLAP